MGHLSRILFVIEASRDYLQGFTVGFPFYRVNMVLNCAGKAIGETRRDESQSRRSPTRSRKEDAIFFMRAYRGLPLDGPPTAIHTFSLICHLARAHLSGSLSDSATRVDSRARLFMTVLRWP